MRKYARITGSFASSALIGAGSTICVPRKGTWSTCPPVAAEKGLCAFRPPCSGRTTYERVVRRYYSMTGTRSDMIMTEMEDSHLCPANRLQDA